MPFLFCYMPSHFRIHNDHDNFRSSSGEGRRQFPESRLKQKLDDHDCKKLQITKRIESGQYRIHQLKTAAKQSIKKNRIDRQIECDYFSYSINKGCKAVPLHNPHRSVFFRGFLQKLVIDL